MSLTLIEQLKQLINSSKYILVVFASAQNTDAVGSALAIKTFLEKQRKQVDVAASGFNAPKNLSFLADLGKIKPELTHLQKFIIKVDLSRAKIETLSYDIKDDWLSIYLTPKQGLITKNELRTAQTTFKYDLIITLNTADLEALGGIYLNNTDLFYRVPVINIDHNASNEHYGQLNILDLTATSTAEVVFGLLQQIDEATINAECATALLSGMIGATKSFKTPNVTPATLAIASKLMSLGADREKIVKHLYRTRSIASLKLWGQALTHLQHDYGPGLVWTALTREDFVRSGAAEEDLLELTDELIASAPEAKIILIIFEAMEIPGQGIKGIITVDRQYDALELTHAWSGAGNKKTSSFVIKNKSLKEAEEEVIKQIRTLISNHQ